MKIDGSAVRSGMVVEHEGKLWLIVKHEIRTPGNLRSFNQVEMKDLKSSTKKNARFSSNDMLERAHLDSREYQYLYEDGENITLMDTATYEQINMNKSILGDGIKFLNDGMMLSVDIYEGSAVSARLPETVILQVTETEPVVKGQTAASSYKPAMLENGVRVMVPPFIAIGDKVVVRTSDSSYMERANKN